MIKYASKVGRMRIEESVRRSTGSKRYKVEVTIKENRVKAFADTGADICIMSKKKATELSLGMKKTKMTIHPYGSNKMKCCGYNVVTVMCDDKVANVGMYIINKNVETLLSGRAAEELGIITFNADSQETGDIRNINTENDPYKAKVIAKHPRIFKGVGILRDYRVKHYFEESVPPIAEPRRQIPFHLQAKFEREIRAMEEQGIIEEHHGPAPWVSNPVLTPKDDGGMRVTIDMRNANKAIKQTNIPITKVEDIKARLAGSKVFSKIDFKSAFRRLQLEEESKYITVFHAGERLMRSGRLTMGHVLHPEN